MKIEPFTAIDSISLLQASLDLTVRIAGLEQRRGEFLDWLMRQIGADGGFWCWGRGKPLGGDVTPVAAIVRGFSEEEWFKVVTIGMTDEAGDMYRKPYVPYLKQSNLVCFCRSMLWTDEQWQASPLYRRHLRDLGFENWCIGVRYVACDTWCCLSLHRRFGRPDFSPRDVTLTYAALGGIPWLSAEAAEASGDQSFDQLTPRQRAVMLCLLDGLSRKEISRRLEISVHTVNDHIKTVFKQLGVTSVPELAARFLKSK
jgi:DNA-binding CsgD family transcriptional regulator